MSLPVAALTGLTDAEILAATVRAAADERAATVHLIALLAELDTRRLYLGQGCSSLFTYCTRVLHLSEHAAYGRIEAARCARRIPAILDLLAEGAVTLTSIGLIAPHLTPENAGERLTAVRHKSKREVEQLVAAWRPLPPVPSSVRKLPGPAIHRATPVPARCTDGDRASDAPDDPDDPAATTAPDLLRPESPSSPPSQPLPRPSVVRPLAPGRYKVQFTVSEETYARLRRAQELLRPVVPNGDPAAIFDRALTMLVADLERTRCAAAARPRPGRDASRGSRHVPAAIKRQVWSRDEGQCAFVGTAGRCTERGFLEVHHIVPFADGGRTDVDNLALRCRAHNQHEAEQWFGPWQVREVRPAYCATRSGPS